MIVAHYVAVNSNNKVCGITSPSFISISRRMIQSISLKISIFGTNISMLLCLHFSPLQFGTTDLVTNAVQ